MGRRRIELRGLPQVRVKVFGPSATDGQTPVDAHQAFDAAADVAQPSPAVAHVNHLMERIAVAAMMAEIAGP